MVKLEDDLFGVEMGEGSLASGGLWGVVLAGGGLERLVELSVSKKARLNSDRTLVAVITAVSTILVFKYYPRYENILKFTFVRFAKSHCATSSQTN